MKKSLKSALLLCLLITAVALLCACGESDGAPEGMQLCEGSDTLGFYFYVPEEWMISSYANIYSAYVAKVDTTSASYTEVTPPAISGDETIPLPQRRAVAAKSYFDASMSSYKAGYTTIIDCESVTFGNADLAFKFVYDHEYQNSKFRTMQILVYFEDRFGIFTFNSYNTPLTTDKPQFEYYAEKSQGIIDSFKFVSAKKDDTPAQDKGEPVYDADGYLLASDKKRAGFELYIPKELEVIHSDGLVAVQLDKGASITATKSNITGVTYDGYFKNRLTELETLFGSVTVIKEAGEWECFRCKAKNAPECDKCTECQTERSIGVGYEIEGAAAAFLYEYTYTFMGEEYRVYQVLAATRTTGYSFTYTARATDFEAHLDTVRSIFGKVKL